MGAPDINTYSDDTISGKTKVFFKQWYHNVQCVNNHYPKAVVWEGIIQSLNDTVADMDQYMGPTAIVDHILQKLSVLFGMVAKLDVLMQYFYKVSQGNN